MSLLRVAQAFNKYFIHKPPQLGRWGTVTCSDALQKRIDLANIDHCGPCGHHDIPPSHDDKKYHIHSGHFEKPDSQSSG